MDTTETSNIQVTSEPLETLEPLETSEPLETPEPLVTAEPIVLNIEMLEQITDTIESTLDDTSTDSSEEISCNICGTEIVNPFVKTPCGHDFCNVCFFKWLSIKPNCPVCRTEFVNENTMGDLDNNRADLDIITAEIEYNRAKLRRLKLRMSSKRLTTNLLLKRQISLRELLDYTRVAVSKEKKRLKKITQKLLIAREIGSSLSFDVSIDDSGDSFGDTNNFDDFEDNDTTSIANDGLVDGLELLSNVSTSILNDELDNESIDGLELLSNTGRYIEFMSDSIGDEAV